MKYYSTNGRTAPVSLKEAVIKGLPSDNGLFMPERIATLPPKFFENISSLSFQELALEVAFTLLGEDISKVELEKMIGRMLTFDAPLAPLSEDMQVLELFHGHTLAFKDFGARFMAQLMGYFVADQSKTLHILVATSGDTGSAVAHGFLNVPNIHVTVLYPSGKVSNMQEKQFTTLGNNITALEINGTFDDCQKLVKQAFLDNVLNEQLALSSANSINIARLIPQTFYYFRSYALLKDKSKPVVFAVPSGNFGNLTAGLIAKKMGLPIHQFLAATNQNNIVPNYLQNGIFQVRPSVQTISNAMDVGNPSNFARMMDLYPTLEAMQQDITGYWFDDNQTVEAIVEVKKRYNYVIEPHGAIGYLALKNYLKQHQNQRFNGIILETAHPVKFPEVVEQHIHQSIEIPERLQILLDKPKLSIPLSADFEDFKEFLLHQYATV
jgi:threonine synthase